MPLPACGGRVREMSGRKRLSDSVAARTGCFAPVPERGVPFFMEKVSVSGREMRREARDCESHPPCFVGTVLVEAGPCQRFPAAELMQTCSVAGFLSLFLPQARGKRKRPAWAGLKLLRKDVGSAVPKKAGLREGKNVAFLRVFALLPSAFAPSSACSCVPWP